MFMYTLSLTRLVLPNVEYLMRLHKRYNLVYFEILERGENRTASESQDLAACQMKRQQQTRQQLETQRHLMSGSLVIASQARVARFHLTVNGIVALRQLSSSVCIIAKIINNGSCIGVFVVQIYRFLFISLRQDIRPEWRPFQ